MAKWGRRMGFGLIGLIVAVVGLWAGYTYFYEGNLGQPAYSVTAQRDGVEYRHYEPFVIASIQSSQGGDAGLRNGFRRLAGYIFGGNTAQESISMTAPVLQQNTPGESLPMTAPVLQSTEEMRMAFVMPAGRSIDSLPVPNNVQVRLSDVDWGEAVVIRFSGRGKQAKFVAAEATLREVMAAHKRVASGPALYAQYNSPSAFPPLRRNEVIIPLAPQ